jgi:acetyltransferase-like isoleucine patch superfamily enzyme
MMPGNRINYIRLIVKVFDNILYMLLKSFGPAFSDRNYSARLLLKHVIAQKIFRVNSHVPWPVHWTSKVKRPEKIKRGTRCPGISIHCYLDGRNGIILGENVRIGPGVSIISMNHDPNQYDNFLPADPIRIGDNCWLGAGTTILPGVQLGNHVICAAGAVVTKSFADNNVLVAGVPARIVKKLGTYVTI